MACLFCGGTGQLTNEHVFPRWMRELFPDVAEVDYRRLYQEVGGADEEVDRWPGAAFTHTVGGVCAACNNGWMADLEGEAKTILSPLIFNSPKTLTLPEMHIAATWATKTALVAARAVPGGKNIASAEAYRWMGTRHLPLPNGIVWLGRYDGEGEWPVSFHLHGAAYGKQGEPWPPLEAARKGFHAVFAVGHLAFCVFGHELPEGPVIEGRPSERRVLIWPSTVPVRWPPAASLTEDDLRTESEVLPT
jgi:hypothetical protein